MAIVSFEVDPNKMPEITPEQEARLKALAKMPDREIDCSDIPEITDFSGFMNVEEFEAYRVAKRKKARQSVTAAAL